MHTSHWSPSSGYPKHPHAGAPATILCLGPKERTAPQPPADGPGPKRTVPAGGRSGRQDTLLRLAGLQDASAGRLAAPPFALPEPGIRVCTPVTMGPRWERAGHVLRAGAPRNSNLSLPPRSSVCLRQALPPGLGVCAAPGKPRSAGGDTPRSQGLRLHTQWRPHLKSP